MKKITADYIFTMAGEPVKDGIIILDSDGTILDVVPKQNMEDVDRYEGVICPGFVNTHCHLELSHLKGKVKSGGRLPGFIAQVQSQRIEDKEKVLQAIEDAEHEMIENGIVAVGDICNTDITIQQKMKGNLHYYNFIELFGFRKSEADKIFAKGESLFTKFRAREMQAGITPHASYSVSEPLFEHILHHAEVNNTLISIHNQESRDENLFFLKRKGDFVKFYESIGFDINRFEPTGLSALQSILSYLSPTLKTQFVHNTFTNKEDLFLAINYNRNKSWWCFCPSSNIKIEKALPNFEAFKRMNCQITIGTDSLASTKSLSIFDELKIIGQNYPDHNLADLLQWATINGAKFLGLNPKVGAIRKGSRPGLNLIENVDFENMRLTPQSQMQKLV